MSSVHIQMILIRHGETRFNREGRIQGSLDSELTDRGQSESILLGESLQSWLPRIDMWMTSPQGRARQSSRLVRENYLRRTGLHLPEEELEESAREIHCGSYEGKTMDQLDPAVLQRIRTEADFPYPEGESLTHVMERGRFVIARVIERASRAAVAAPDLDEFRAVLVSHGNFIRAFGALITGLGPAFALRAFQNNTGVNRLLSRDSGRTFKILTWNDISHAHSLAEQFTNLGTG